MCALVSGRVGTGEAQRRLSPNPSFERTHTGMQQLAFISFWANSRMPARASQLKRYGSWTRTAQTATNHAPALYWHVAIVVLFSGWTPVASAPIRPPNATVAGSTVFKQVAITCVFAPAAFVALVLLLKLLSGHGLGLPFDFLIPLALLLSLLGLCSLFLYGLFGWFRMGVQALKTSRTYPDEP